MKRLLHVNKQTEFGYLDVNFVLGENLGPLLLEMNARSGLSIQVSNQEGLIPRLEAVDSVHHKLADSNGKIGFARQMFGD